MDLGQRLKSARNKLNLTIAEVSARTAIGDSSLSEFENGRREPKISQLAQLGEVYRQPLSYFFGDVEVSEQTVLWRLRPDDQAPLLEREFLKLCEQYRLLEEWNHDFIDTLLPRVEAGHGVMSFDNVAELARRVSRELNLGERPAFVLLRVLEEDCGIKVFHRAFEPTGTAACVKSAENGWAILLNAGNSACRRSYDLAHELFHLLVWDLYRGAAPTVFQISPDQEEKLANVFAAHLLISEEALRRAVDRKRDEDGKILVSNIPDIAQQFGVSIDALLWRIHQVYNIGNEQLTREVMQSLQLSRAGKAEGESNQAKLNSLPDRYRRLAVQALNRGEISLGRFMEFMEVSRREAMKYLAIEEYAIGEIQLTPA